MKTSEKLAALRYLLREAGAKAVYVGTTDPHQTESVSAHWKAVQWLTGFTGSMGYAVVTEDQAEFWTDGRYTTQAAKEIELGTFHVNSVSEPGTPDWHEWLAPHLNEGDAVAVDGEVLSESMLRSFKEKLPVKGLRILYERNLVGEIWADRPSVPEDPVWELAPQYAVESRSVKLAALRERLKKYGPTTATLICGLDDIAWLTNLRGNDNPLYPFFHAYAYVTQDEAHLCTDLNKVLDGVRRNLQDDGWTLHEYKDIEDLVKTIVPPTVVYADPTKTPFKLFESLSKDVCVKTGLDEVTAQKAQKSEGEQKNIRLANTHEAVAVVRLMRWIEANVGSGELHEYAIGQKLNEFREKSPLYLQPANLPIVGYGENAALPHYRPSVEQSAMVKPYGFLLFDVCAQYLCGTTDLTRTVAVGELTDEMKLDYTITLKAHLTLARQKFPYGVTGNLLDAIVKSGHWNRYMNFGHGTGHGMGYVLNVHEGPGKIIMEYAPLFPYARNVPLEAGMLFSDEPGVYKPGRHGIRIENSVLVQKSHKTEFGQFMEFETVTFLPYERKAILLNELTQGEIDWIDRYHINVYKNLADYLNEEEKAWLKEKTRPLQETSCAASGMPQPTCSSSGTEETDVSRALTGLWQSL